MSIPVTVFTGFLGSGKTTIILNLLSQLPANYNLVLLKNEFGNIAVDSKLAENSNIKVTEMLNGCLCCILVGKLGNAIEEILAKYKPDRIIIETSGSAYPAPIAWEISKIGERLKLDGIVTVIDAENFEGYKDTSYTAKLQAQYTDMILINKHETLSEQQLDKVLDDVYDLNPSTPKIRTKKGVVDYRVVFGLDSKLALNGQYIVQDQDHQEHEVEIIEVHTEKSFKKTMLEDFLQTLPKWDFYRIKGIIRFQDSTEILNFAFGKWDFTRIQGKYTESAISFMGKNLPFHLPKIASKFELDATEIKLLQH